MPSAGREPRILVVEDEMLICLLIETILMDAGYEVVLANSLDEAFTVLEAEPPRLAILDLNLKGQKVFPVAERLASAGIPFIFATGGGGVDAAGFRDRPTIAKPFQEDELLSAVSLLLN
jgi:DNA-binding response OmpR family regulator